MNLRKILTLLTLAFLVAAGAAGYYIFRGGPTTFKVRISQEMIDSALARKFPKDKTYLKIIRITYANPRAVPLPGQGRVRIALDARAEIGIKGLSKSYQGSAAVTTGVGYRPDTHTFELRDAQVEYLDLPKLSQRDLTILREGLNLAAAEWAPEITVYQLSNRDTRHRLAKLALKRIEIEDDQVVATLGL